jgi:hypothetical protein
VTQTTLGRHDALRAVMQRLHHASFRKAVLTAYSGRCALSAFPEPLLPRTPMIVDKGLGLTVVRGVTIRQPIPMKSRPDRDRLALRVDRVQAGG